MSAETPDFPTFPQWLEGLNQGTIEEEVVLFGRLLSGRRYDAVADLRGYITVDPKDSDGSLLLTWADLPYFADEADPDVARWAVYEYRATRREFYTSLDEGM